MPKKDFTAATGRTYEHIADAVTPTTRGRQIPAGAAEAADRASAMRTQGRAGCKIPRVTMAFTPENHEFIRTMAGFHGMTMAGFVNSILAQYREENMEKYQQAKDFRDNL